MSFWSSERLLQKQRLENLIDPFEPQRVKQGAYELSLGSEAFISTELQGTKQKLEPNEQLVIPPGQFGLLLTKEIVDVPNYALGFISIRFSIKMRGLVNVSGFHVDPGFKGRLKFAVYNAGSQNIVLAQSEPVFIIWFSDLSGPTPDSYNGKHDHQDEITSEDVMQLQGEVASPAELKKQLDETRREYDQQLKGFDDKYDERLKGVEKEIGRLEKIFIGLMIAIIVIGLRSCLEKTVVPSDPTTHSSSSPESNLNINQNGSVVNENNNQAVVNENKNQATASPSPTHAPKTNTN